MFGVPSSIHGIYSDFNEVASATRSGSLVGEGIVVTIHECYENVEGGRSGGYSGFWHHIVVSSPFLGCTEFWFFSKDWDITFLRFQKIIESNGVDACTGKPASRQMGDRIF